MDGWIDKVGQQMGWWMVRKRSGDREIGRLGLGLGLRWGFVPLCHEEAVVEIPMHGPVAVLDFDVDAQVLLDVNGRFGWSRETSVVGCCWTGRLRAAERE